MIAHYYIVQTVVAIIRFSYSYEMENVNLCHPIEWMNEWMKQNVYQKTTWRSFPLYPIENPTRKISNEKLDFRYLMCKWISMKFMIGNKKFIFIFILIFGFGFIVLVLISIFFFCFYCFSFGATMYVYLYAFKAIFLTSANTL